MIKIFVFFAILLSLSCFSQNEQLAQYYYDKGDFEKAKIGFEELLKTAPQQAQYFVKIIECYQQLKQYEIAEKAILAKMTVVKQGSLLVELGYNYHLQKNEVAAKKQYDLAIERIKKNPSEVYAIENAFERKIVLEYALKAYQTAVALEPKYNFNYQMAQLHGQLGNTDLMIESYLTEAFANSQSVIQIQNQLSRFMSDQGDEAFKENLRKALILRTQKNQDVFWNQFLSWFYVQQKEFSKAFIQEKAAYKRNPETLSSILNLAQLAIEDQDLAAAKDILNFVLENSTDVETLIETHTYLIKMQLDGATEKDYLDISNQFETLLSKFGTGFSTLELQLYKAHFNAFNLKKTEESKQILKTLLELQISEYDKAKIKMEFADVLLFEEKFNQALLYYSQIEENLKNDAVAHEASLKAAKTSYFQGDFEWASKQFKELKSASSQLIANDALEYFLLISDNTIADSTQTALKQFAKADYLIYQKRTSEATVLLESILKTFKGKEIEAISLLRLGQIHQKKSNYTEALVCFQSIIDQHATEIYVDEALFLAAEIYNKNNNLPEKAKPLYEKIIFNHQDSIFYVDAQREFRKLRGDKITP